MGTAVAWPYRKYKVVEVETKKISDTCDYPENVSWSSSTTEKYQPWPETKKRENVAVLVRLESVTLSRRFCVATYHMPCVYGSDERMQMMNIHTSLLLQYTQEWARSDPLIVCGDFNFYPTDSCYEFVLTGSLPTGHPQAPVPHPLLKGRAASEFKPMRSAYKVAGGEPEFTALTCEMENDPKLEVLDYIFISPEWKVESVVRAEAYEKFKERRVRSLPCDSEPSDHILIASNLSIIYH